MLKISIVTISFNQAEFLEDCIQSVLDQKYPNLEYIVVDPGSTDGSREIIKKYENFFTHIIFESDKGPADGLNKGFAMASGEIFYFLNSDDILLPNAFFKASKIFEKNPNIDILLGNGIKIDAKGQELKKIKIDHYSRKSYVYGATIIFQQGIFFRKRSFELIGGFNTNNRISWDAELLIDFSLKRQKIKKVHEYFGAIRIYGETISNNIQKNAAYKSNYLKNKDRLFQKVMGRQKGQKDKYFRYLYFLLKIMYNPHNFKKLFRNEYNGLW